MAALEIAGLSKTFGRNTVLDSVDMRIGSGEIRMLLGHNGSGKSTLIKILSGFHAPDPDATVLVGGEALAQSARNAGAVRFVHQDLGLIDDLSVEDNIGLYAGFPRRRGSIDRRLLRELVERDLAQAGVDVDPALPVAELSPAQCTGVAIARALADHSGERPSLLVLDEPTAALPRAEVRNLVRQIREITRQGVGVLYVTHRLEEVDELGDHLTVLRNGRVVLDCPIDETDRATIVRELTGDAASAQPTKRSADGPDPGEPVDSSAALVVDGLRCDRLVDVSFTVRAGEVVGFGGITGSGIEQVLPAVFGAIGPRGGSVIVGGKDVVRADPSISLEAGMAFVPADRKRLGGIETLTSVENLTMPVVGRFQRGGFLRRREERATYRRWSEQLRIHPVGSESMKLAELSGGNQQKVVLAKWLEFGPVVLLLHEPTQGVDVGAKAAIHHQILQAAEAGIAVVVSSNDVDELALLCDRILRLEDGRVTGSLHGSEIDSSAINHLLHLSPGSTNGYDDR